MTGPAINEWIPRVEQISEHLIDVANDPYGFKIKTIRQLHDIETELHTLIHDMIVGLEISTERKTR